MPILHRPQPPSRPAAAARWGPLLLLTLLLAAGCSAPPPAPPPTPSVVLVTVDALPASLVATWRAGGGGDAPLDRLAHRADWLGTAVVSSSQPLSALASLLTGFDPWQHQVIEGQVAGTRPMPTLASALAGAGWHTEARVPAHLGRTGLVDGFAARGPAHGAGATVARLARGPGDAPRFVWLHLALGRPLDGVLEALTAGPGRDALLLVVTAAGGDPAGSVEPGRDTLSVPLLIARPGDAWRQPALDTPATTLVEQRRLAATVLALAGLAPPPAAAPSLGRRAAAPILASRYFTGGRNRFLLLDGPWQLRWDVPFAPAEATHDERLAAFAATPPLSGTAATPPEVRLEHVGDDGTASLAEDPDRRAAAERTLRRLWHRHVDHERPPGDELNP